MDSGNVIVLLHIMIGKNMITIAFLADHLDTKPTLAKWFRSQWSDYFTDVLQEDLE